MDARLVKLVCTFSYWHQCDAGESYSKRLVAGTTGIFLDVIRRDNAWQAKVDFGSADGIQIVRLTMLELV